MIFFPDGWLGVSPTVLALIDLLVRRGYRVSVYGFKNNQVKPLALPRGVEVMYLKRATTSAPLAPLAHVLRRAGLSRLLTMLDTANYIVSSLSRSLRTERNHGRCVVAIGVDRIGALTALVHRRFTGAPFLWLSLELCQTNLTSSPTHVDLQNDSIRLHDGPPQPGLVRLNRWLLGPAFQRAAGVIIQDEARFRAASRLYGSTRARAFLVPNSPLAGAVRSTASRRPNFFRERFDLDPARYPHIVLHAGGITPDFYALEIARGFAGLADCALIFHERTPRREDEPIIRALRRANATNLFLSLTPVPYEELDRVYAAATIGLAFYRPLNDDMREVAMASGKIAFYLRHGKPIITNDIPSLRRLIDQYDIGAVIGDPSDRTEVKKVVARVLANYTRHSENARHCFTELFDFERNAAPVLEFLDELSGHEPPLCARAAHA